jgi:hypothetical protein
MQGGAEKGCFIPLIAGWPTFLSVAVKIWLKLMASQRLDAIKFDAFARKQKE